MTYWIALALFAAGALVPEIVRHGVWLLREDETESVLLLGLTGALFAVYLLTDRRLRAVGGRLRDREQELRDATKDLAGAYGHIGEVNRKIDIVRDCADRIARHGATMDRDALCRIVRRAARVLTRAVVCHVYVVAPDGTVTASSRSPLPDAATAVRIAGLRPHQTLSAGILGDRALTAGAVRSVADGPTVVVLYAVNGGVPHDDTDVMLLGILADAAATASRR